MILKPRARSDVLPARAPQRGLAKTAHEWLSALFRAVARPIFCGQVAQPQVYKRAGDPAPIEAALRYAVLEASAYLEGLAPERYLVAGELTIANLAVLSNLVMFHYRGQRIDARYPRLARYFQARLDTPVLAEILER